MVTTIIPAMYQALFFILTGGITFHLQSPMKKAHYNPHFSNEAPEEQESHPALREGYQMSGGMSARGGTVSLGDILGHGLGGQEGFLGHVLQGQCVQQSHTGRTGQPQGQENSVWGNTDARTSH